MDTQEALIKTMISYEKEIVAIIEPLKKLGIHYFTFVKKEKEEPCLTLSTHPEWIKYYYNNDFHKVDIFEKNQLFYSSGWILWSQLKSDPIYTVARNNFDIANGITLIRKIENSTEFYHFGSTANNNHIIPIYINNIHLFYRFIPYFLERAKEIILNTSCSLKKMSNKKDEKGSQISSPKNDQFKIEKYYLPSAKGEAYLTKKEVEIIKYLKIGKTAEEVGMILTSSKRTVEEHIKNIRHKLHCHSLFELGLKLGHWDPEGNLLS